ncbi:hypothetical protein [Flavobacterium cerinum]|uniref:Abortive infection protein-like C-terminal domain-containing protein n=1 Tax=Flavobacterium cerinum TaxID=2502784 RepID=A0ABY5IWC8_9FLAO|nr:hypothetical protein [Flavobacterium cerinum]UUC46432.1 hypothetical protein NOX80_04325 [Flavobacterium cerinum]
MNLTRAKIEEFKDEVDGLTGYYLIIDEIEDNLPENPDISIESCKSLIEGLSKKALELISDKYNADKQLMKACEGNMSTLVKTAFDEVYKTSIEKDLHESLYNIIQNKSRVNKLLDAAKVEMQKNTKKAVDKIAAIRHDRGDISHGRVYPKKSESELHLANSILSITDGICSFMIHELAIQYQLKLEQAKMLVYKEEGDYNQWLDEQNDNLLTKIDFSRLLYNNNYEKYEEIFYSEYQDSLSSEKLEELEELDKKLDTIPLETVEREIENLINTFQEQEFWTPHRLEKLEELTSAYNFVFEETRQAIEEFLFTEKDPLPDEAIQVLIERPNLKERKERTEFAIGRIKLMASILKDS